MSSSSQEKLPVTLWLTYEQLMALCDSATKDLPTPSPSIQQALSSVDEFKKKSQDKDLQLQLTEAFLLQNKHLRNLLNESAAALGAYQKNYEKDKKQIDKLKKEVREGKREKKESSHRREKSATIGSSSGSVSKEKEKDEVEEKKEHKRHARRKSVDHSGRRLTSSSSSKKGSISSSSVQRTSSKKDATASENGKSS